MKKIALSGIAWLALCLGFSAAAAETLSYGSYLNATHNAHTEALEPFFEAVKQETDGSLNFRLFTDGTVVGAADALNGIRDGLVDMAMVVDLYVPSVLPTNATVISELALFPGGTLASSAATNEMTLLHCDQCVADWKQAGVQPLAFYSTAPYHLMCTSKAHDLGSISGKRIRATGAWPGWVVAMGGVPVSISSGESYAALNRGTIDCTLGSLAWLNTYGLADVVDYVLDMPIGAYRGTGFLNMGLDEWKGLSDAEKAAVKSHLAEAVASAAWSYREEAARAAEEARAGGTQFLTPGEKMQARYDTLLEDERERVIALAKERGIENAEALVDRYLGLLDKWEKIVADIDSKEEYVAALEKRIFDKVEF